MNIVNENNKVTQTQNSGEAILKDNQDERRKLIDRRYKKKIIQPLPQLNNFGFDSEFTAESKGKEKRESLGNNKMLTKMIGINTYNIDILQMSSVF